MEDTMMSKLYGGKRIDLPMTIDLCDKNDSNIFYAYIDNLNNMVYFGIPKLYTETCFWCLGSKRMAINNTRSGLIFLDKFAGPMPELYVYMKVRRVLRGKAAFDNIIFATDGDVRLDTFSFFGPMFSCLAHEYEDVADFINDYFCEVSTPDGSSDGSSVLMSKPILLLQYLLGDVSDNIVSGNDIREMLDELAYMCSVYPYVLLKFAGFLLALHDVGIDKRKAGEIMERLSGRFSLYKEAMNDIYNSLNESGDLEYIGGNRHIIYADIEDIDIDYVDFLQEYGLLFEGDIPNDLVKGLETGSINVDSEDYEEDE